MKKSMLYTLIISVFILIPPVFAGQVTLTSYYPSPYGEYKNLKSTESAYFATSSGAVSVGVSAMTTKGLLTIAAPDDSVLTALSIRQNNNILYGFDFALDTQVNGNLFLDRVNADTRVNVITFDRSNGNVAIGTTDTTTYKLRCNGQPGANGYTAWTNYSDRRLKENIKSMDNGVLEKIIKLNPSTFNYNDKYFQVTGYTREKVNRKMCGFVAQEIREIFPEMVTENKLSGENYMDTNLTNLQIYLVKAIQEQQKEIANLKNELQIQIDSLKKEIAELKKRKTDSPKQE